MARVERSNLMGIRLNADLVADEQMTTLHKLAAGKGVGRYKPLRELARTHRMVVADVVRTKNRIKSVYRSRGVPVAGKSVYISLGREKWQEQLPEPFRGPLRTLYAELDAFQEVRNDVEKALVQDARQFPITKLLATSPGFGTIRAAQLEREIHEPLGQRAVATFSRKTKRLRRKNLCARLCVCSGLVFQRALPVLRCALAADLTGRWPSQSAKPGFSGARSPPSNR